MDDYKEQPSERVWAGVSKKAGLSNKRSIPVWIWSSCAAAALATGVFLFFDGRNVKSTDLTADNIQVVPQEKPLDINPVDNGLEAEPMNTEYRTPEVCTNTAKQNIQRYSAIATKSKIEVQNRVGDISSDTIKDNIEATGNGDTSFAEDSTITTTAIINSDDSIKESKSEANADAIQNQSATTEKTEAEAWKKYLSENPEKTRRKFGLLSASIHANSSAAATGREKIRMNGVFGANPLDQNSTTTGWIDPDLAEKGTILFTDDISDIEMEYSHKMPVILGLSVRYDFGKRFGVETGLTYSILSSDVKQGTNKSGWSKGEQTLNYVGIPLRLSFDIFSSRYFDLYVSAGGMMEKAVRGRVTMDNYRDGQFVNTSRRSIKPKEIEWSANASVGAQCNILPQLGIFVEPGISYHFKSNAPVRSIYTDQPTNFSIGFGIRWTFLN